jgi:hypothetical protein
LIYIQEDFGLCKNKNMKIKHYIVTYDNNTILNRCLESLWNVFNKYSTDEYQCFIINNHSNFSIDDKFKEFVTILNNILRPDFSTGHLSRNWNQSIINGFVDLNKPDCDILINSQNDCEFDGDFIPNLIELHEKYSFVQLGAGDNFMSYTVDSIKKVGLWDERFCNIGYQEADYFLRNLLYNTNGCSINDYAHSRLHNVHTTKIIKSTETGHQRKDVHHYQSIKYHQISQNVYNQKWGDTPQSHQSNWNYDRFKELVPKIQSFVYYPYFEKDVETLIQQNFVL